MSEAYDLEAVHDAEIAPLMAKIIEVCNRERIPMLASFAYRHRDGERRDFCTTFIPAEGRTSAEYQAALQMIRQGMVAFAVTRRSQ